MAKRTGIITAKSLRVRTGPGTSYPIVGGLKGGDRVEILDDSRSWYEIVYDQGSAYVSGKYVASLYGFITGNGVRVRKGPATNTPVEGTLNRGDKVEVLAKQGVWYNRH